MQEKKKRLEVQNLVKSYSGRNVVDGLSFTVEPGEIVGLLGANGAGKTTAFYMTVGLVQPDAGEVYFGGERVTALPMCKRARMGMGYLSQEPSVFRQLTVEENLLCALEVVESRRKPRMALLERLLEELHLTPLAKKPASALSGGERRRLEITRALATSPSCLMLDEPFANIDPLSIAEVQALIRLLADRGIGILITDHNAREIFSTVHRSYLVREGRILKAGTVEELVDDPTVRKFYLGEDFRW